MISTRTMSTVPSDTNSEPTINFPLVQHDTRALDVLCRSHRDSASAGSHSASATNSVSSSTDSLVEPITPHSSEHQQAAPYILILLNQPLDEFFLELWQHASYRLCADGASNRLYEHFTANDARLCNLPHAIIGDFDSSSNESRLFYSSFAEVYVRKDSNQENTDLEKCLEFVKEMLQSESSTSITSSSDSTAAAPPSDTSVHFWNHLALTEQRHICSRLASHATSASVPIIVYPAFGGRFDQQISHLHIAYKHELEMEKRRVEKAAAVPVGSAVGAFFPSHPMLLLSSGNSVRILLPNLSHCIRTHPCLEATDGKHHCGLWPLHQDATSVNTRGLKWNLDGSEMKWSRMISTSNKIGDDSYSQTHEVCIRSDVPMVFTSEMHHSTKEGDTNS